MQGLYFITLNIDGYSGKFISHRNDIIDTIDTGGVLVRLVYRLMGLYADP